MSYTILDLEWNSVYSRRISGYFNEIIQFGAVRLDEDCRVVDSFSTFVRPSEGKKLTDLVMELTSIRPEDLEQGISFLEAFEQFLAFMGDSILMTWGNCDVRELIHNYRFFTEKTELPITHGYIDLQAYCQSQLGAESGQQMGLSTAAEALEIDASAMALHRAIDDSILSAECFRRLYDAEALQKYLQKTDGEFYRRLAFKNKFLTDLNHPLIDRKKMNFRCTACGAKLAEQVPWALRGKQFAATLHCDRCSKDFRGFVQFQQRFDEVRVRRHLTELRTKPEDSQEEGAEQ